ncbi:excinuclease ABC subunit UvrB [Patescibacteria group bacterium]
MKFKLKADFKPTGDQPEAIKKLTNYFLKKDGPWVVLLGVTGSGKTFSVAHLIQKLQLPTLVISHNKTLAAQLYQEFKEFFPQNGVGYFVSYYDYYQPEAYMPQTDTYIAKETDVNDEIEKLRLEATSQILSRKDMVVIASVSCIYNLGSPEQYQRRVLELKVGQKIGFEKLLSSLVTLFYRRSKMELSRGLFRVRGERVEIYPSYLDKVIKISMKGDQVEQIATRPVFESKQKELEKVFIFPAKHYIADEKIVNKAFGQIREDLKLQTQRLKKAGRELEANRLHQRVNYDLEMIKEMGYVNGIENYSRYFDGRLPGEPPSTLLEYFWHQYGDKFLIVIDESHMTVPQIRGMYRGDQARKQTLIDFGFRLPSALDNRPLKFDEFLERVPQALFLSATPNEWEIEKSKNKVVEQMIRPTGVMDPEVEVRSSEGQIQDLIEEVLKRKEKKERVLVTTLTKRTAEELSRYLSEYQPEVETPGVNDKKHRVLSSGGKILVQYLHSDVDTLERTEILADLRKGSYDVIVGVNLLREGLDLPEVSLVAVLDADQPGFLRSRTALIQTMGRAARNTAGLVIFYADEKTPAIKQAMSEAKRRRRIQLDYNLKHNITPKTIQKPIRDRLVEKKEEEKVDEEGLTPGEAKKLIKKLHRRMREMARELEFEKAAKTRDQVINLRKKFDLEI